MILKKQGDKREMRTSKVNFKRLARSAITQAYMWRIVMRQTLSLVVSLAVPVSNNATEAAKAGS
jgi:hypothetical protein